MKWAIVTLLMLAWHEVKNTKLNASLRGTKTPNLPALMNLRFFAQEAFEEAELALRRETLHATACQQR